MDIKVNEKGKRKQIMHFGIWNTQRLKNKCEIINKDLKELILYIINLTETKKKGNRVEMIGGFIFIMEYLKRSEQKDGFL